MLMFKRILPFGWRCVSPNWRGVVAEADAGADSHSGWCYYCYYYRRDYYLCWTLTTYRLPSVHETGYVCFHKLQYEAPTKAGPPGWFSYSRMGAFYTNLLSCEYQPEFLIARSLCTIGVLCCPQSHGESVNKQHVLLTVSDTFLQLLTRGECQSVTYYSPFPMCRIVCLARRWNKYPEVINILNS